MNCIKTHTSSKEYFLRLFKNIKRKIPAKNMFYYKLKYALNFVKQILFRTVFLNQWAAARTFLNGPLICRLFI